MTTSDSAVWEVERLVRRSNTILIIYYDKEVRGQVECHDDTEVERWLKTIEFLNEKSSMK